MASQETRKTPKAWLRNLLLGSAALNVFLAGFLFARFLGPDASSADQPTPTVFLGGLPPDLPPNVREEFEKNFRVHKKDVEENYEDLFQARINFQNLMEAMEFNEEELNEALEEIRGLQIEIQGSIHETMMETLRDMDPEMRRIFITGGDEGLERGIWSQRQFDGTRWQIDVENGEITIDFSSLRKNDDEDEEDGSFNEE